MAFCNNCGSSDHWDKACTQAKQPSVKVKARQRQAATKMREKHDPFLDNNAVFKHSVKKSDGVVSVGVAPPKPKGTPTSHPDCEVCTRNRKQHAARMRKYRSKK
jgi:hypothetical protein